MGCCSSVDISDERSEIDTYIETDVTFRNNNNGKVSLDTQLRMRRPEVICIGAFMKRNPTTQILIRDQSICKYRPDLVFVNDGKLIHVEIDEHGHENYSKEDELKRELELSKYFIKEYGNYKLIRFNVSNYKNIFKCVDVFCTILENSNSIIKIV